MTARAASPLIVVVALVAAGCSRRAEPHRPTQPSPPAMTITVFDDGFHSGFILPYAGAPEVLDPQRADAKQPLPYVEVGFGEALWLQGLDRSWLHALRLGVWPSEGMLLLVNLPDRSRPDRDERSTTRYWEVSLTAAGVAAFYAELDRWIDRSRRYVRPPDDPQFFAGAATRYTVFTDCHDFTIALLRATRFPISAPLVTTAGRFDAAMDRGSLALVLAGIDAIGP